MTGTAYLPDAGPIGLAHRGFSREGWENSMPAFQAAVDLGYEYVETDVHATRDGVVVAFHDATLERLGGTNGAIADLPWAQVRQARILGEHAVPTLEELLTAWPTLRVNIDVKAESAVAPFAELVNRLGAHDRICVASFSDRRRRRVLRSLTRPTATSAGQGVNAAFWAAARTGSVAAARRATHDVDLLQVPERLGRLRVLTRRSIALAHRVGLQVHVWTVDDPADMHRLLDLGVDGILTDRADLLRDVLRERGAWPPARN